MLKIHSSQLRLRPLRIPGGFYIMLNAFYDILDNGNGVIFENPKEFVTISPYELYKSTISLFRYEPSKLFVDLGWGPEADPEGTFCITVLRIDDRYWEHPLVEFFSRYGNVIEEKLNELMQNIAAGRIK